jgi:hypothetical protein
MVLHRRLHLPPVELLERQENVPVRAATPATTIEIRRETSNERGEPRLHTSAILWERINVPSHRSPVTVGAFNDLPLNNSRNRASSSVRHAQAQRNGSDSEVPVRTLAGLVVGTGMVTAGIILLLLQAVTAGIGVLLLVAGAFLFVSALGFLREMRSKAAYPIGPRGGASR